jgi:hypothetical protein
MKVIVCMSLVFATLAYADEAADRSAIERVIGVLNDSQTGSVKKPTSTLFTPDADSELDRLSHLDRRLLQLANEPWSEVTTPRVVIHSIRFVTPNVALVNAANTQYGSTILVRRIPLLFVMRKEGTHWRIASLRVLVDLMRLP